MSYKAEQYLDLPRLNQDNYIIGRTETEKKDFFLEILNNGIHGFCFLQDEEDLQMLSEERIKIRMNILKSHATWVRLFYSWNKEQIIKTAKVSGLKTLVEIQLGKNLEINDKELEGIINLAKAGFADIVSIANPERNLSENALKSYMEIIKKEIAEVTLGYSDVYDRFSSKRTIIELADVVLASCNPFLENCPSETALNRLKQMYETAKASAQSKPVIISETGWPSYSRNPDGAIASTENALDYFINTHLWMMDDNVDCFYLSCFDSGLNDMAKPYKNELWGIWDKNEQLKY